MFLPYECLVTCQAVNLGYKEGPGGSCPPRTHSQCRKEYKIQDAVGSTVLQGVFRVSWNEREINLSRGGEWVRETLKSGQMTSQRITWETSWLRWQLTLLRRFLTWKTPNEQHLHVHRRYTHTKTHSNLKKRLKTKKTAYNWIQLKETDGQGKAEYLLQADCLCPQGWL